MDVSVIFQFLKDLAANNNREWFQGHKDEYLKAQKEFEELLTAIIARISLFDESIVGIQAKDCTCLLYTSPSPRDVEESRMPSSA